MWTGKWIWNLEMERWRDGEMNWLLRVLKKGHDNRFACGSRDEG